MKRRNQCSFASLLRSPSVQFIHPIICLAATLLVTSLAIAEEDPFRVPAEYQNDLGGYRSPLLFEDGSKVKSPSDWSRRRQEILDYWNDMLGRWPPLLTEPKVEILETITRSGGIKQYKVRFLWTPVEETVGYLLIPAGKGKRPAVLTVFYEPETAVGLAGENRDFAWQLAQKGFVALSVGSTKTTQAKTYATYFPGIENATVEPLSMLGCAAANCWHVLAARPEVDPDRIGIVGHSYGGKWAMFAGALFDRFAAVAVSDPGIMFSTGPKPRPSINYWEPWYLGWHKPPWRKRGLPQAENPISGAYPRLIRDKRDLHEIHALIAPRPFLVSGGSEDPPERWRSLNHLVQINRLLGYERRVGMTNRAEHSPTPESNKAIVRFFETFLGPI
ncbi:MAG TPA: sialidase [Planctomycetaceae bacterium]|nr:sialidase [Planctomycetaceae bacterium]